MVARMVWKRRPLYLCGECGLGYEEKAIAEACESHCREHHSCSLEITSHAVPRSPLEPD